MPGAGWNHAMKGIILAGGKGTRLHPLTKGVSKQLLPLYSKPMIYYPLSVLMAIGIRDILLIINEKDQSSFQELLGDGSDFGVSISYTVQPKPDGLPCAFILGGDFIAGDDVALILGDNFFYGDALGEQLRKVAQNNNGASILAYPVDTPEHFGVVEFDEYENIVSIEEKPTLPKSNYAVPGCYFYDSNVSKLSKSLRPSARGELEIGDLNKLYLAENRLSAYRLGRGVAWFDAGTYDSLFETANFVKSIENRQGLMIGCLEEMAWRNGWISVDDLLSQAHRLKSTPYGKYLESLVK